MSTQQQSSEEAEAAILRRFSSGMATATSWDEDADLLREARSKIPFDLLIMSPGDADADADGGGPSPPPPCGDDMLFPPVGMAMTSDENGDEKKYKYGRYHRPDDHKYEGDDLFLKRLTLWFQRDFMTWVNAPPCKFCGCEPKQMKSVDTRPPMTDEEKAGGASRVEVYNCPLCNTETTFPRYNSPRTLLETRKGRCGEYANLFGLICRSAGFETRYVLDLTDHVWVECWSFRSDRWLMADSCEGKIDAPGMYERGWGKKLSHIFAFDSGHGEDYPSMTDVTMRYTRKFDEAEFRSRRAEFCPGGESVLESLVARTNATLRRSSLRGKKISPGREAELERRRKNETDFFQRSRNLGWDNDNPDECEGRTSGSLAWRASRDEVGTPLRRRPPPSGNLGGRDDAAAGGSVGGGSYLVESFLPNASCDVVSITARCVVSPGTGTSSSGAERNKDGRGGDVPTRHPGAITVSGVRCAVGDPGLNVVTVDEVTGCILQTRVFGTWSAAGKFVDTVPDGRIVAVSLVGLMAARMINSESGDGEEAGCSPPPSEEESSDIASSFHRLGGFPTTDDLSMVAYVGQVGFHPGWASAAVNGEENNEGTTWPGTLGVHVRLRLGDAGGDEKPQVALKEDRNLLPRIVSARVPESIMPLRTQLLASEEQKMKAAQSAMDRSAAYVGYLTQPGHAIYLLAASAFPFVNEASNAGWVIRRHLPKQMVPETETLASIPIDIPTDVGFFTGLLGPSLLRNSASSAAAVGVSTSSALESKRLVALYFSAHWCPPCKGFTPMLAEFYETIKDENPSDLEVVFVSSDRDPGSFSGYFSSMPWLALPFEDRARQQGISARFGIRGIPALVILDAISGSVISQQSARNDVHEACRGGDDAVKLAVANWISNVPEESRAIVESIELSLQVNVEKQEEKAQEKANAYFIRKVGDESQEQRDQVDPAERVKFHFAQLVAAGRDPTTAAAEAIKSVAEEQRHGKVPFPSRSQLEPGQMNTLPWLSVCCLDCVSSPNWREGDKLSHFVFSDATNSTLLPCRRRIEGINLLSSSSSANIVGIQSLYGDGLRGEEHIFIFKNWKEEQTERGAWSGGEQKAYLVAEGASVHTVEGVMGTSGVEQMRLISSGMTTSQRENGSGKSDMNGPYTVDSDGKEDSFPFCLIVPRGLELLGFHGVVTADGIVSLGLVCGAARDATDSFQGDMSTVTVRGKMPDIPANVAKCATDVVRVNGNEKASIRIVLSTATKYLDNALKEPWNPKFRTFKLNNKVSDRICQVPGGLDMIVSVGFAVSNAGNDFIASLPLAADLEAMRKTLCSLMEYYED